MDTINQNEILNSKLEKATKKRNGSLIAFGIVQVATLTFILLFFLDLIDKINFTDSIKTICFIGIFPLAIASIVLFIISMSKVSKVNKIKNEIKNNSVVNNNISTSINRNINDDN